MGYLFPKNIKPLCCETYFCICYHLFKINTTPLQFERLTLWPFDETIIFSFNKAKASP